MNLFIDPLPSHWLKFSLKNRTSQIIKKEYYKGTDTAHRAKQLKTEQYARENELPNVHNDLRNMFCSGPRSSQSLHDRDKSRWMRYLESFQR